MAKALLIVVLGVIVISCAITPPLYYAISANWVDFPWPYSRVFDRVILVVAVALLVWQRKALKLPDFKSLFGSPSRRTVLLVVGFFLSAISALAVMPLVVHPSTGLGWAQSVELSKWLERILKVLLTAVVVSLLEELLFRGAIYQSVRKKLPHYTAAALISLGYAVVHFLAPNKSFTLHSWNPILGFEYFGTLLTRLVEPGIIGGIVGLWLVGMTLSEAVHKTRSLYLSLGLHAGWIFAQKASMYLTQELPGAQFPSGLGRRYFLVAMPEVWATVMVAWILVFLFGAKLAKAGRVDSSGISAS